MKRILSMLLAILMLASMITLPTFTVSAAGNTITPDTSWYQGDGPYYISDAADLLGLVQLTHAVTSSTDYSVTKGKTFYLTADIDLNPGWTVGDPAPANIWKGIASFAGTLDGQGHCIRGIYAPSGLSSGPIPNEFGFIGRLVTGGTVKNLTLTNGTLVGDGSDNLGSIAGVVHWGAMPNGEILIENCHSSLSLVANSAADIGGLYGSSWQDGEGTLTVAVKNSSFSGTITKKNSSAKVGQIAGRAGWTSGKKIMNIIYTDCTYPTEPMFGYTSNATVTVTTTPVPTFVQKTEVDPTTNTFSIRIVGGLETNSCTEAGFRVFLTDQSGRSSYKVYTTTEIRESIQAAGKTVLASELHSKLKALYAVTLDGISADAGTTIMVTPLTNLQGEADDDLRSSYVMFYEGEDVTDSWEFLIPSYNLTPTEIYQTDDVSTMREFANVSAEDFERFVSGVQAIGYTISHNNKLGDNRYAYASNGVVNLFATHLKADGTLRLYSEPALRANPSDEEYTGEKTYTPKMWQRRVDNINSRENGGMSYIFLLTDGSFFLIDGGYPTDTEADNLYAFLKQICADEGIEGEPVITGWYFSHTHGDHIGAIQKFAPKYADKVKVKAFYYHFESSHPHEFDVATAYWQDAIHYSRLHTGQKIHLPGIDINVMYTLEDLYTSTFNLSTLNWNNRSAMIRIDVHAGETTQRVMFLGDLQVIASAYIMNNYRGNYDDLKSDIVQFSHHGYEGGSKELYDAIAAPTVIWPINVVSTQQSYGSICNVFIRWGMGTRSNNQTETDPSTGEKVTTAFPNAYIWSNATYVKKIILAAEGEAQEFGFPYTPSGARQPDVNAIFERDKPILIPDPSKYPF